MLSAPIVGPAPVTETNPGSDMSDVMLSFCSTHPPGEVMQENVAVATFRLHRCALQCCSVAFWNNHQGFYAPLVLAPVFTILVHDQIQDLVTTTTK